MQTGIGGVKNQCLLSTSSKLRLIRESIASSEGGFLAMKVSDVAYMSHFFGNIHSNFFPKRQKGKMKCRGLEQRPKSRANKIVVADLCRGDCFREFISIT